MALQTIEQWTNLLTDTLQFPAADAEVYAKTFVDNSYDQNSIKFLSQGSIADANKMLQDIGIKQGHSLALLFHFKSSSTASSSTSHINEPPPKLPPMKRPTVNLDMSHQAFRKFCFDWKAFVNHYSVAKIKLRSDIYQCCSDDVQSFIVASSPKFLTPDANDTCDIVLDIVKGIVTKNAHPLVHRLQFCSIKQENDESCQDFLNRIRASAPDCDYKCTSCEADISEMQIRDQFVRGLINVVLQTLLVKSTSLNPDISLTELLKESVAFEQSLRDHRSLSVPTDTTLAVQAAGQQSGGFNPSPNNAHRYQDNAQSQQQNRRSQHPQKHYNKQSGKRCKGCGSSNHLSSERQQKCKAWNFTCENCHKLGHFTEVCFSQRRPQDQRPEVAASDAMIGSMEARFQCMGIHSPQPDTLLPLQVIPLGTQTSDPIPKEMQVFPDTGANLCLMGPAQLKTLELTVDKLTPISAPITVVGGSTVSASGHTRLKLSIGNQSTEQLVYFCDRADRFFLGRQACRELGISPSFPFPPNIPAGPPEVASLSTDVARQPPPPKPQDIPYMSQ